MKKVENEQLASCDEPWKLASSSKFGEIESNHAIPVIIFCRFLLILSGVVLRIARRRRCLPLEDSIGEKFQDFFLGIKIVYEFS